MLIDPRMEMDHSRLALTACACLFLTTLLIACDPNTSQIELPVLPPVATDSFLPTVSDQLLALQNAVDEDPRNADKTGHLGMAYLAYRQDHAAEVALERAGLLQPQKFEWSYYHAEALTRLGRLQDAANILEQASSKKPGYSRTRLGLLYLQLGNLDSARVYLAAVVSDEPANAQARLGLARLHLRAEEPHKARVHLEKILEQQGGIGIVFFVLSEAWRQIGDEDKAREYLTWFEKYRGVVMPVHDPLMDEVYALDLSEKPLLQEARRLNQQGRTGEAIEILNQALERNPDSHLTRAALVGAYGALKQFDKVDEHYRLALESAPPTAPLLQNLARARFYQGRFEEARTALEQALVIDPYDAGAVSWLGIVYLRQNKPDQGIATLTRAVQMDSRDPQTRMILAEVLHRQGHDEEALVHLRELVNPERKNTPRAWRLMGQCYVRLGKTDEARQAFTAAVASAKRMDENEEARLSADLLQEISR